MSLTSLHVELFVEDLDASVDFYRRVLGFIIGDQQPDGYTPMRCGAARISLNRHTHLPVDHPVRVAPGERAGRGVEFVLCVEDLHGLCAQVQAAGWPITHALQRRPWGREDFRIQDPDGFYLRFTTED